MLIQIRSQKESLSGTATTGQIKHVNHDDPRITGEHIRSVETPTGTVTLVGVVHDHPASVFRVRTTVSECNPDVLALELPPLSLPLFERYAEDTRTPPVFGGEASAAIQAASTDHVVGIDGPTPSFLRRLLTTLYRDASFKTASGVLSGLTAVTKSTFRCRLAGASRRDDIRSSGSRLTGRLLGRPYR